MSERNVIKWLLPGFSALVMTGMPVFAQEPVLRDPTRPYFHAAQSRNASASVVGSAQPQLQAVFSKAGSYSAMIDGQRVRVGDSLADYAVESVDRNSATLARNGKTLQLRLSASGIKQLVQEEQE